MRTRLTPLLACLALLLPLPLRAADLHVSAAIRLKETLTDAANAFEAKTTHHVQLAFASSGALLAQIRNGSPADVFISAADQQMDDLQSAHLIDPATRRIVATNTLVLIIPANAPHHPASFKDLTDSAYAKIAVGEPRTVPAGAYAVETLKHLHLFDTLSPKLVYGSNVRQVLVYVERGEADAGIVYSTDARQAAAHVTVAATANPADHAPINYPGAIVSSAADPTTGKAFLDFLASPAGQKILADHGFSPPPAAATQP